MWRRITPSWLGIVIGPICESAPSWAVTSPALVVSLVRNSS